MSSVKNLYIAKKTENGYFIKIKKSNNKYIIFDPQGKPEYQDRAKNQKDNYFQDLIKVVFFGYNIFEKSCCKDSKVNFFYVKKNYLQVPYCLKNSSKIIYLPIKVKTNADIFPALIYYISNKIDILEFGYKNINLDFIVLCRNSYQSMKDIFSINLNFPQSIILILENLIPKKNKNYEKDVNLSNLKPVLFCRLSIENSDFGQLQSYLSKKILSLKDVNSVLFYIGKLKENEFSFSLFYVNFLNKCINLFHLYKNILSLSPLDIKKQVEELTNLSFFSVIIFLLAYKEQNSSSKLDKYTFWLLRLKLKNKTI